MKDWFWSWNSNTLATWCEELTHLKRPWCWERLKAGEGGDNRRWEGWMASPTRWTWVWVSSGNWWWTGKPGVLQSTGLQRVGHDWAAALSICLQSHSSGLLCYTYLGTEWLLLHYIKYMGLADDVDKIPFFVTLLVELVGLLHRKYWEFKRKSVSEWVFEMQDDMI